MRKVIQIGLALSLLAFFLCACSPPAQQPPITDEGIVVTPFRPPHEPAESSPSGDLTDHEPDTQTPALSAAPSAKGVIREHFEALRKEYGNDDIIGYLIIEGTSIDYPVTQAEDNHFYLSHDIYKDSSTAGWIFLDYENNIDKEDRNTVIYGHNMRRDIMFHSLRNYVSEDFYKNHRYIIFNTIYEDYIWEVFSFYKADTSFNYIQVIFPAQEDYGSMLSEMEARSLYDTGVEVTSDDRILTLSTCVGGNEDERYVLHAKLLNNVSAVSMP